MEANLHINLMLLGREGAGKSSSGNTILGREAFTSEKSSKSVRDVAVESGIDEIGFSVTVYDTPGFLNTDLSEHEFQQMKKSEEVFQKCEADHCVFLLVIKADRFTDEERETVEKIEMVLGEERLQKTCILFTGGDELEEKNKTIQEFINETELLKKLLQKFDQRYHVFNNKKRGSSDQARVLLLKIIQRYLGLKASDGGRLTRWIPVRPNTNDDPDTSVVSLSSRRILLLGKTGVGKSAVGNTILGQKEFNSVMSMNSVTRKCSEPHATVSDRSVSVVDTPGFFDTQMKPEELMTEIARSVYLSSPGPHAFLIVFRVDNRFTEQEEQIPQQIETLFGEEVLKYSIILFTHGDQLEKPIEEQIKENSRLRYIIQQCGGRFHVFNNKDQNNREQVNDLLQKIDTMIEQNGGGHYSNQMFEDAERFRREEEEQRQREEEQRQREEEQRQREEKERKQEEKHRQEIERVKKETEQRIKEQYEARERQLQEHHQEKFIAQYKSKFRFSAFANRNCLPGIGAIIFGCIGASVGIVGGPPGIAAGGVFGTVVGTAIGTIMKENNTEKQKKNW